MTENAIAKEVVDAAYRIHTTLGPGLLESVYDTVLAYELNRRGLRTARQQAIPVVYENVRIDAGFRADMIVEDKVIVEVKSVELLAPVHKKQLLKYLRLADKSPGDVSALPAVGYGWRQSGGGHGRSHRLCGKCDRVRHGWQGTGQPAVTAETRSTNGGGSIVDRAEARSLLANAGERGKQFGTRA
jgi:GxxExxY protein